MHASIAVMTDEASWALAVHSTATSLHALACHMKVAENSFPHITTAHVAAIGEASKEHAHALPAVLQALLHQMQCDQ